MGPVQGNTVCATSGQVANNGDGTYTVPVNVAQALEVNRFENGGLQDLQGYLYPIVDNTESSLRVRQGNNPAPPWSNGDVWFWDDDQLRDGQDVPMPDLTELVPAMEQAYVGVLQDIGDSNDLVTFRTYLPDESHFLGARDWDSILENSASHWVTYILGAFQEAPYDDNDPNAEVAQQGRTSLGGGGSVVFLESIGDAAREGYPDGSQEDPVRLGRELVVHEVGHAVACSEGHPVTRWEAGERGVSRYTEQYLAFIRMSSRPAGPS